MARRKSDYTFFALLLIIAITLPAVSRVVHGEKEVETGIPKELRGENVGSKTDHEAILREEEQINPDGLSLKEQRMLKELGQTHTFQAEVSKLMNIIINSLYSNTEVFLRELISNASDALDKIRFLSLTDSKQLETNPKLEIKIKADPQARTLTITDSGVGMTQQELVSNLGTIAKSGTTEFLDKFHNGGQNSNNLIGQFGVGFYSAYLVADEVVVVSKNNEDKQYVWQSDAKGAFTVTEDPRGNTLGRGTSIILKLKEDAEDFLDEKVLKALVTKYSEFINFPIYLWVENEVEKEVPLTEDEIAQQKEELAKKKEEQEDEEEISLDEESEEETKEEPALPTTKIVKEKVYEWKLMNEIKPIWTRSSKDITEEEYNDFYKAIAKDFADPLKYIHFNAEGEVEFKSILYIPSKMPQGIFDPSGDEQGRGIKLYVKRVFITDNFKDLLPKYLQFIKGVVDSDDLPLNVSREMLQESKLLQAIKKKIIRKAIAMFQELAEEEDKTKYQEFWRQFGNSLKLGIIEDQHNKDRLSKLMMFQSSKTKELTTLGDYVSRMKEGQSQIYYLGGESLEMVQSSPLIETLVKKGYEVLFMVDPIDEYAINHLEKFDGKYKLTNIGRENLKLDGDEEAEDEKKNEEEYKSLTSFLKSVLGHKIDRVVISSRLTQSPSALVAGSQGMTANMERIFKAQALAEKNAGFYARKILEINPQHPIIKELLRRVSTDAEDQTARDIAELMYDTASLQSGFALEDTAKFSQRVIRMMNLGLSLDVNAAPEEVPEATTTTHDEL
jgi:heat shock protein beta